MTPDEIKTVCERIKTLWIERTPAKSVNYLAASYRVSMSEIITWGKSQGIKVDRTDENFQEAVTRMMFDLRRKYPDEKWDSLNVATVEFCKRRKIPIPKKHKPQPPTFG